MSLSYPVYSSCRGVLLDAALHEQDLHLHYLDRGTLPDSHSE